MGAHKYNPTAIAAKEGKIPPKKKPDKRVQMAFLQAMMELAKEEPPRNKEVSDV